MTVPAVWLKHRPLASAIASDYYLPGSDRQDVEQEALIALWEAARTYTPDRGATFRTFAAVVIRRRLVDCVRQARRQKSQALNGYASLEGLPHLHQVTDQVDDRERLRNVVAAIGELPPWQRQCVIGVASGLSYAEIGFPKSVENALRLARAKLKAAA